MSVAVLGEQRHRTALSKPLGSSSSGKSLWLPCPSTWKETRSRTRSTRSCPAEAPSQSQPRTQGTALGLPECSRNNHPEHRFQGSLHLWPASQANPCSTSAACRQGCSRAAVVPLPHRDWLGESARRAAHLRAEQFACQNGAADSAVQCFNCSLISNFFICNYFLRFF